MIFEVLLVVLFFLCAFGLGLLFVFLTSYFRGLGLKKAFDKKNKNRLY